MTKAELFQIEDDLHSISSGWIEEVSPLMVKLVLGNFKDRNGVLCCIYAFRTIKKRDKKIKLIDGGEMLRTLKRSGMGVQMNLLQQMLASYGLTLLEDGTVLEQTNRPMQVRLAAMLQAWSAMDGILRSWTRPKENI